MTPVRQDSALRKPSSGSVSFGKNVPTETTRRTDPRSDPFDTSHSVNLLNPYNR
jgi:hypothetical protein